MYKMALKIRFPVPGRLLFYLLFLVHSVATSQENPEMQAWIGLMEPRQIAWNRQHGIPGNPNAPGSGVSSIQGRSDTSRVTRRDNRYPNVAHLTLQNTDAVPRVLSSKPKEHVSHYDGMNRPLHDTDLQAAHLSNMHDTSMHGADITFKEEPTGGKSSPEVNSVLRASRRLQEQLSHQDRRHNQDTWFSNRNSLQSSNAKLTSQAHRHIQRDDQINISKIPDRFSQVQRNTPDGRQKHSPQSLHFPRNKQDSSRQLFNRRTHGRVIFQNSESERLIGSSVNSQLGTRATLQDSEAASFANRQSSPPRSTRRAFDSVPDLQTQHAVSHLNIGIHPAYPESPQGAARDLEIPFIGTHSIRNNRPSKRISPIHGQRQYFADDSWPDSPISYPPTEPSNVRSTKVTDRTHFDKINNLSPHQQYRLDTDVGLQNGHRPDLISNNVNHRVDEKNAFPVSRNNADGLDQETFFWPLHISDTSTSKIISKEPATEQSPSRASLYQWDPDVVENHRPSDQQTMHQHSSNHGQNEMTSYDMSHDSPLSTNMDNRGQNQMSSSDTSLASNTESGNPVESPHNWNDLTGGLFQLIPERRSALQQSTSFWNAHTAPGQVNNLHTQNIRPRVDHTNEQSKEPWISHSDRNTKPRTTDDIKNLKPNLPARNPQKTNSHKDYTVHDNAFHQWDSASETNIQHLQSADIRAPNSELSVRTPQSSFSNSIYDHNGRHSANQQPTITPGSQSMPLSTIEQWGGTAETGNRQFPPADIRDNNNEALTHNPRNTFTDMHLNHNRHGSVSQPLTDTQRSSSLRDQSRGVHSINKPPSERPLHQWGGALETSNRYVQSVAARDTNSAASANNPQNTFKDLGTDPQLGNARYDSVLNPRTITRDQVQTIYPPGSNTVYYPDHAQNAQYPNTHSDHTGQETSNHQWTGIASNGAIERRQHVQHQNTIQQSAVHQHQQQQSSHHNDPPQIHFRNHGNLAHTTNQFMETRNIPSVPHSFDNVHFLGSQFPHSRQSGFDMQFGSPLFYGNSEFLQELMYGDTTDPPDIPDKPGAAGGEVELEDRPPTTVKPTTLASFQSKHKGITEFTPNQTSKTVNTKSVVHAIGNLDQVFRSMSTSPTHQMVPNQTSGQESGGDVTSKSTHVFNPTANNVYLLEKLPSSKNMVPDKIDNLQSNTPTNKLRHLESKPIPLPIHRGATSALFDAETIQDLLQIDRSNSPPTVKSPITGPIHSLIPITVSTESSLPIKVSTPLPYPMKEHPQSTLPINDPPQSPLPIKVPTQSPYPIEEPTQSPLPIKLPTQSPYPIKEPTQSPLATTTVASTSVTPTVPEEEEEEEETEAEEGEEEAKVEEGVEDVVSTVTPPKLSEFHSESSDPAQNVHGYRTSTCTPYSNDFGCRGKHIFQSMKSISTWCVQKCRSSGCVQSVCLCECNQGNGEQRTDYPMRMGFKRRYL